MMVNLWQLPEEIVLQIHIFSLSPFLPQTHPAIYQILHNSPRSHVAQYLIRLYAEYGPDDLLVRAVRHEVCSVAVATEIRRIWDRRKGKRLTCSELPRRIFRTAGQALVPPLLAYLMDTYSPSPNSHKGYPLCRAVLTSNKPLIEYLLDYEADPAIQESLPVRIATQMGRLDLVKLLVEPQGPSASGKRAKRPDRVVVGPGLVELAMKSGHEHIVRYFVHDKGIIPPLRSIMKLGGGGERRGIPRKRPRG